MESLARFADSPLGSFYAAVCERYGIDPAASLEDDVEAFNLRAGLALVRSREAATEGDDAFAANRRMERWMKDQG